MNIFTCQNSKQSLNDKLSFKYVDTSRMSGVASFAPTWEMVRAYKEKRVSEEDYIDQYIKLMRVSYVDNPGDWESLLDSENIVIGCMCRKGLFCHRNIFVRLLMAHAKRNGIEAKFKGELEDVLKENEQAGKTIAMFLKELEDSNNGQT